MGVTSPLKYLQTRTKALPFHECYMTQNWKEVKMASVLISREMPSGNFVVGIYLVDMLALGVKDTFYRFNMSPTEYEDFVSNINASQEQPMISSDLHLAHNIIFGALDFGEEHGFRPHKDFKFTQLILDEDYITDEIDELEFGQNGQPMLMY